MTPERAVTVGLWRVYGSAAVADVVLLVLLLAIAAALGVPRPQLVVLGSAIIPLLALIGTWIWWSILVPLWRVWAYDRVSDIGELKRLGVARGLIWPEGHPFERTEIRIGGVGRRLKQLEAEHRSAPDAVAEQNRLSSGFLARSRPDWWSLVALLYLLPPVVWLGLLGSVTAGRRAAFLWTAWVAVGPLVSITLLQLQRRAAPRARRLARPLVGLAWLLSAGSTWVVVAGVPWSGASQVAPAWALWGLALALLAGPSVLVVRVVMHGSR